VLGGEGKDGVPVADAELFDPEKATFQALRDPSDRSHPSWRYVAGRWAVVDYWRSDAQGAALSEAELLIPSLKGGTLQRESGNSAVEPSCLSPAESYCLGMGCVDTAGIPVSEPSFMIHRRDNLFPILLLPLSAPWPNSITLSHLYS